MIFIIESLNLVDIYKYSNNTITHNTENLYQQKTLDTRVHFLLDTLREICSLALKVPMLLVILRLDGVWPHFYNILVFLFVTISPKTLTVIFQEVVI